MIENIKCLKGNKLIDIGRSADLLWMVFEDEKEAKYSLHVQCPWRIYQEQRIIASNNDIYVLNPEFDNNEDVEWDTIGANLFDRFIKKGLMKGLLVENILLSEMNDLTIKFSKRISFENFVNTDREECWRFFKKGWNEHLVVPCEDDFDDRNEL